MTIRTRTRTRPTLDAILERAAKQGQLRIKNKRGQVFVIRPERKTKSPLDVKGVDLKMTGDEIVQFIHEGRRSVSR
ncbi:MAG: type II toxin-antitoxin system Phd/YefM family antitoxin [Chloroflexi bacterium]|nr:type II toxin-antitoxin system Phd/YefM family antitoxin [Chloroflexota bacterium]